MAVATSDTRIYLPGEAKLGTGLGGPLRHVGIGVNGWMRITWVDPTSGRPKATFLTVREAEALVAFAHRQEVLKGGG